MLDTEQLLYWSQRLDLTERAVAVVKQIRCSPPARHVQGRRGNVCGRYPSKKMGLTIQFESHKNELAHIRELEHASNVIEYYDQPPTIKLIYQNKQGHRLGVLHTPDFFVIRQTTAGWEECKPEEELIKLAEKNPNRYSLNDNGSWHCPPGEAYAAQFGFYYHVHSSAQINWTWQRNIEFLEDYYRGSEPAFEPLALSSVCSIFSAYPYLTLGELFRRTDGVISHDDLYKMIAFDTVYVDLSAFPLTEPDRVRVFPDQETAIAYNNIVQTGPHSNAAPSRIINLVVGNQLVWDGQSWTVVNIGETMISLVGAGNAFTELPITAFEKLVSEGRISGADDGKPTNIHPEVSRRLACADHAAFAAANRRAEVVRAYLDDELTPDAFPVPARTVYYWVQCFRKAQELFGSGYIGLLDRPRSGNKQDKLSPATKDLLSEFIEKDYETLKQKKRFESYAAFLRACEQKGVEAASYKTFCMAIRKRPKVEQTRKRQGVRAAYQEQSFYWELTLTTPRHGERPFQIAHIDHTELDVELVCSITGQLLGRPWSTFLTDAYSRRLLAVYLTFDPPSYRSCMMAIRESVRRFNRLPQTIVVDGGLEFSGVYFETLLARYECTKKTRPTAASRFGSVCERLFGTANTQFVHNLEGNTQLMRQVRVVTKSCDPRIHAVWTLEKLHQYLCEWAYEVYDTTDHPALGQSPRAAFIEGKRHSGERHHRLIPYNENFLISTLPTTSKGTAKVMPCRGVKINNLFYWAEAFRDPSVENTRVEVRFDPNDIGRAYAFVEGQWVECYSEHYAVFHGHSERELMIAGAELKRRRSWHTKRLSITGAKLARFLESVEAEEVLLRQRLADREAQSIRYRNNGGAKLQHPAVINIEKGCDTSKNFETKEDFETKDEADNLLSNTSQVTYEAYGEFR